MPHFLCGSSKLTHRLSKLSHQLGVTDMSSSYACPFRFASLVFLCLFLFFLHKETTKSSGETARYRWMNVTNEAAYAPRDGAGALVFQNKM